MTKDTTLQTVALVGRALRGERGATRKLVEEIRPAIRGSVARTLLSLCNRSACEIREEIDDFTQTVLLHLFVDDGRLLRLWDPARGRCLRSFVALLARRRTLALLRSRRQNPWSEEPTEHDWLDEQPAPNGEPESTAVTRETIAALTSRLRARLSPRGSELFEILFLEERSTEDACSLTGMTPGAIHTWRSRLSSLAREVAMDLAG